MNSLLNAMWYFIGIIRVLCPLTLVFAFTKFIIHAHHYTGVLLINSYIFLYQFASGICHIYIYIYIYRPIYIYKYIYICICVYVYICVDVCVCSDKGTLSFERRNCALNGKIITWLHRIASILAKLEVLIYVYPCISFCMIISSH